MDKKQRQVSVSSSAAEYLTYVASAGPQGEAVELRYEDENIWLTQRMLAALYGVTVSAISQHVKSIFADGELAPAATIKKYLIVRQEGKPDSRAIRWRRQANLLADNDK